MKKDLFIHEFELLNKAKTTVNQYKGQENPLLPEYEKLLKSYERLMKVSKKTERVSDKLNTMLQLREEEIQLANERLKQVQESRRQFISDITHEMGSPMAAVQNYLKAILENQVDANHDNLNLLYDHILMVNQLVKELFELSTLEDPATKLHIEEVTVSDLCKLIQAFKFEVEGRGLTYKYHLIEESNIHIKLDKIRIKQVLNNFIYNAFRYTPAGNSIEVTTEIHEFPSPELRVTVTDSGSGIEKSILPYIFDRFYKDEKKGGTGLGLAIAKEIITLHGGEIGVKSLVNKGSSFYFTLPIEGSLIKN